VLLSAVLLKGTMTFAFANQARRGRVAIVAAAGLAVWTSLGGNWPTQAAPSQVAPSQVGDLEVLTVRPGFFLIVGAGGNVGVQVGEDGVVVVDAGTAAGAPAILAAIKRITPKPIRYVIDTGPDADHVGGNEVLSKAGEKLFGTTRLGGPEAGGSAAPIVATEGVLGRLSSASGGTAFPAAAWPSESFHYARKVMFLNGEPIEVLQQPAAHTDGDAFVFFRRSDVVMAGDVLDTRQFPVIDIERGGSIEGEIAALKRLVDLAVVSVPVVTREAGTIVVPGHGRLCDQLDVVDYRDMVVIVRDRVRDLLAAGRSLDQVKAAQPAKGYVGRYGSRGGASTADQFVEAIYRSLTKGKV
jgi:cyclase